MEPVLESKNLTKIFPTAGRGDYTAVDRVSFQLQEGETLGVVGESGCGKSTLAKLICRLTDPTAGTIHLLGRDITYVKGRELRKVYRQIQMVFQSPTGSFDPRKTIGYSIGESLANAGVSRTERTARVTGLLEQCGLPGNFAQRYPHEISGGQCQRAAIARALAAGPRVLICDEATSALDVTVQKQIMDLLVRLKQEHQLSVLFICHNLALVQSFCDRVLVMYDGSIVEEGTPDEVILTPRCDYTKHLVDAALYRLDQANN